MCMSSSSSPNKEEPESPISSYAFLYKKQTNTFQCSSNNTYVLLLSKQGKRKHVDQDNLKTK